MARNLIQQTHSIKIDLKRNSTKKIQRTKDRKKQHINQYEGLEFFCGRSEKGKAQKHLNDKYRPVPPDDVVKKYICSRHIDTRRSSSTI